MSKKNIAPLDDLNDSPRGGNGAFPDFHHKMSKKIAQLTKVIYHLNTKNDDHEFQLKNLTDTYESEIEEILQDTSRKINHFRDLLEKKRNDGKLEEAIKSLSEQHNREKQKALEEFDNFKRQTKLRELNMNQLAEEKIQKLTNELNMIKGEFQAQMNKFALLTKQIEEKSNQTSDQLKDAHAQEIEELVLKYNKKYNDMLHQMMNENDETERKLKEEFERKLELIRQEEYSKLIIALEEEERKRKLALETMKKEFTGSHAETSSQLQHLTQEIQRLKDLETLLNTRLSKQMIELEAKNNELSEKDLSIGHLLSETVSLKSSNKELSQQLSELKDVIEKVTLQINETKKELAEKTASEEVLLDKCNHLQEKVEDATITIDNLRTQLKGLSGESSSDKNALSQLEIQLRESESIVERLMASEQELQHKIDTIIQDRDSKIAEETQRYLSEIENLKKEHDRILSEVRATNEQSIKEAILLLNEQHSAHMEQVNEETKAQKVAMSELHFVQTKALEDRYDSLKEEYDKVTKEIQLINADSQKDNNELKSKITSLQNEKARMMEEATKMKGDHNELLDSIQGKLKSSEKQIDSLQRHLADLQSQLQTTESNKKDGEKQILELEKRIKSLVEETNQDLLNAVTSKDQALQELRDELEGRMRDTLKRMESDFEKQKTDIIHTLNSNSEKERNSLEILWKRHISSLEDEIKSLKELLTLKELEIQEGNEKLTNGESQWIQREHQMIENHNQRMVETITNLKADADKKITEMRIQHEKLLESKESMHAQETRDMEKNFEREIKMILEKHATTLGMMRQELEVQRQNEIKRMEETKNKEHEERTKILKDKHKSVVSRMEEDMNQSRLELMQEIARMNSVTREKDEQISSLKLHRDKIQNELSQSTESYQKKCEEVVEQRKELLEESKRKQKALAKDHKTQISQLIEEHISETQALNEEFESNQSRMKDTVNQLQKRIEEWELKYKNRESRPEDIERIRSLEKELTDKDSLLQKAVNDMKYFKLELKNRDDTYTKMFGRQQNVGFINPLAAKTNNNSSSGSMKGSSSGSSRLPPL